MNTNHADVSAVQHDLQLDFLYRPAIAARRLDLATARRVFPELNNVVAKLVSLSRRQGCSALTYGCLVNNRQLNGDSRFDARGSTLLLSVPDEFDADLELLAAQEPSVFSLSTISLMGALGYCCWSVSQAGGRHRFMVDEEVLRHVVSDCRASNASHDEPPAIVVPVIVLTRNSLVIGGFWADAYWDYSLAGGVMSKHHRLYSEEVLSAASDEAARIGETPWRGGWWSIDERDCVTEVSVYDMRTPPAPAAPCKTAAEEAIVF